MIILTLVITYRQWQCCDNDPWSAKRRSTIEMRRNFEVNRVVMLGHAADLNTTMRSVNGNGRRRLLFSHQN